MSSPCTIKEIQSIVNLEDALDMAKTHPATEYDCTYDQFRQFVVRYFDFNSWRGWLLLSPEGLSVGYMIAFRTNVLRNEINVFDIFIKSDYRGSNNLLLLIEPLKKWKKMSKALRITWTSKRNYRVWSRILNLPVSEYRTLVWEGK
jgi:hypothetical protein